MKTTLPLMATVSAVMLAGVADVRAQYSSDVPAQSQPQPQPSYRYEPITVSGPLYVGVDAGGNLMQNMHVKNNGTTMRLDPGTRFDVNFGCYIAPPISVEFETGALWNSIKNDVNQPLTSGGNDADLYQVPLLANVVLHLPLPGAGQLYVGGGAGGVVTDLTVYNGFHHHDTTDDSDIVFAYQAMAGLKFPVARNMEVDVGYKFLGSLSHTWFDGDPNGLFTHAGPSYNHSILASFTFNF